MDSAFDAFCLDNFPAIYQQFSSGMNREEKTNILLSSSQENLDLLYDRIAQSKSPPPGAMPLNGHKQPFMPMSAFPVLSQPIPKESASVKCASIEKSRKAVYVVGLALLIIPICIAMKIFLSSSHINSGNEQLFKSALEFLECEDQRCRKVLELNHDPVTREITIHGTAIDVKTDKILYQVFLSRPLIGELQRNSLLSQEGKNTLNNIGRALELSWFDMAPPNDLVVQDSPLDLQVSRVTYLSPHYHPPDFVIEGKIAPVLRRAIWECAKDNLSQLTHMTPKYAIKLQRSGSLHIIEAPAEVFASDLGRCLRHLSTLFHLRPLPEKVTIRVIAPYQLKVEKAN